VGYIRRERIRPHAEFSDAVVVRNDGVSGNNYPRGSVARVDENTRT
jgi:hypothetical protein